MRNLPAPHTDRPAQKLNARMLEEGEWCCLGDDSLALLKAWLMQNIKGKSGEKLRAGNSLQNSNKKSARGTTAIGIFDLACKRFSRASSGWPLQTTT